MYILKVENILGQILELTRNENNYQIIKITGLNPPRGQINNSSVAGMDGTRFNSAKLEERYIVISIKINGDVESNRLRLYKYFITKESCKLYYKNGQRDVFIEGEVEDFDCDPFANPQIAQISIKCSDPYFKNLNMIIDDVSKIVNKFTFPFSIEIDEPIPFSIIELEKVKNVVNDSESECGVIINMKFSGSVEKLEIRNTSTGQNFIINYNFIDNDQLQINTNKGQKAVTLIRSGIEYNLISKMKKGSSFFQLNTGDNFFSYLADDGETDERVTIQFNHYTLYRGV